MAQQGGMPAAGRPVGHLQGQGPLVEAPKKQTGASMMMIGFTTHLSPTRHLADVTPTTVQTGTAGVP
jgi:hypothetical protein